jgi:hypothetical protein
MYDDLGNQHLIVVLFIYNTRNIQVTYCTILYITAAFLLLLKTALFGLLREYDTVARADNYFVEYRMLFSRCRGNESDIFEIARKLHRRHKKPIA